jgi:DNA-binding response OmpR family regulator
MRPGGTHILFVEDDPESATLMTPQAKKMRLTYVLAMGGEAGIDAYHAHDFALVLLDIKPKGMNGFDALSRFRECQRRQGSVVPAITVAARGMARYRERCLGAGFDDYIMTPYTLAHLKSRVDDWLSATTTRRNPHRSGLAAPGSRPTSEYRPRVSGARNGGRSARPGPPAPMGGRPRPPLIDRQGRAQGQVRAIA